MPFLGKLRDADGRKKLGRIEAGNVQPFQRLYLCILANLAAYLSIGLAVAQPL
jgi:hypothetical protein